MLTNTKLTLYHKTIDSETRLEKWIRHEYDNAWWFGGKGAGINKGYDNANNVDIRLPYETNTNLNINDFAIGDIVVDGAIYVDILTQQDLMNYNIYNITSITNCNFGTNPHIHLGGK